MDGLYKDKNDQLQVVIHLENEELLESGEDLSKAVVKELKNYLKGQINAIYRRITTWI